MREYGRGGVEFNFCNAPRQVDNDARRNFREEVVNYALGEGLLLLFLIEKLKLMLQHSRGVRILHIYNEGG